MTISAHDRKRVADAIRDTEARTSGQIVCVLAESSSEVTALPIVIAAIVALALPWLLVALTSLAVYRILSLQVLAFVLLGGFLSLPGIRVWLMPRAARRAVAHRVAMQQFVARGVAQTSNRCGILIFVSLAERYARIVPDDGIAARVPQAEWQAAVDALISHTREGRVADGFVAAIELCGAKLAANFPRAKSDRDELPNRIYVI